MATFFYNRYSNDNNLSQWTKHLQNDSYVEDLTKAIYNSTNQQIGGISSIVSHQTKEINETIKNASREQVAAINQSTNAICGTLEDGFNMLHYDLQEISYEVSEIRSEISSMSSMLDWKLSLLIEQQRITNLLSGNIAILLRIPDIQKERQYHIEQGLKFLTNAFYDRDFYDDSLINLLKAEKIEPTDFFALHRIGLIYLYSQKHLDLAKAEDYFKKAAKYAIAETNLGASITTNFLAPEVNKKLTEQQPTIDTIKIQAAEAYMFAARTCYIEGKLNEAINYADRAFGIAPKMVEAGFTQAKALAANNNDTQAAIVLEKVINTDRFYSLKTLADLDLCPKASIQSLLKKLQIEANEKAKSTLQGYKQLIISESNATEFIAKIEGLINKNTYLASKKAIDLIGKVTNRSFCKPFKNSWQNGYLNEILDVIDTLSKLKFYKSGNSFLTMNADFFDTFIKKINLETQWAFPFHSTISTNSNWTTEIKSKGGNYTLFQFLEIEKKLNDDLPRVISSLKNFLDIYTEDNKLHLAYLETERKKNDKANFAEAVRGGLFGIIVGFILSYVAIGILWVLFVGILGVSESFVNHSVIISNIFPTLIILIGCYYGYTLNFKQIRKKN